MKLAGFYSEEEKKFDELIKSEDFNGLISRYPIRETPVLTNIASGIGLNRPTYESIVRKIITDNKEVKSYYRKLLEPLTSKIIKE